MNEFGCYLKEFMEKKNLKLEYAAEKIGVSFGSLGHYIKGRRSPSYKFLEKFFNAFNISPEEQQKIITMVEEDKMPEEMKKLKKEGTKVKSQSMISITDLEIKTEMIRVPVYNSVSAGAGLEPNPEPVDVILLPKNVADGCVIIKVYGDSMEPTIKDGFSVMVKQEVEVANNDIGIFIHEGEALVKRYRCFDGHCYLYSDNDSYPPREIRKNDEFKICGKVIWIMEKI
ncbi:LexA family transcriptional regulator [uncultured Ilyobacter sp.]|uniref:LexA family transcriptional regulator n=1 Tax=uncultured Ilyobacter sp. TaxID=544433 RepID=UPI0029C01691|nr:LexA family transcriptional regulator [uncultured Ilyobacter sp.]